MKFKKQYLSPRKPSTIVLHDKDGIAVYHYPKNKTVRYVAIMQKPYICFTFSDPNKMQEIIDRVKEKAQDIMMNKLKTPAMSFEVGHQPRKLNAKWTVSRSVDLGSFYSEDLISQMSKEINWEVKKELLSKIQ